MGSFESALAAVPSAPVHFFYNKDARTTTGERDEIYVGSQCLLKQRHHLQDACWHIKALNSFGLFSFSTLLPSPVQPGVKYFGMRPRLRFKRKPTAALEMKNITLIWNFVLETTRCFIFEMNALYFGTLLVMLKEWFIFHLLRVFEQALELQK